MIWCHSLRSDAVALPLNSMYGEEGTTVIYLRSRYLGKLTHLVIGKENGLLQPCKNTHLATAAFSPIGQEGTYFLSQCTFGSRIVLSL